jgi:hypothetical protein
LRFFSILLTSHDDVFRSCLRDCEQALALTPDHTKALVRAVDCCLALRQYAAAVTWSDRGLSLHPGLAQLVSLRQEAVRLEAQGARDERKRAAAEKKAQADERRLLDVVQSRGICVEQKGAAGALSLSDLEPCHPAALHKRLHLDPQSGEREISASSQNVYREQKISAKSNRTISYGNKNIG